MPYLLLLRPHNWIKNFFVFVPLFFAHSLFSPNELLLSVYTFLAFCAAASSVYVMNDIADIERDRNHPQKRNRPLAAGLISVSAGWKIAAMLLFLAGGLVFSGAPSVAPILATYLVANLAYTFFLKRIPIVDLLLVASFYLMRVSAGAVAINVPISGWLLLATIFVALFLVTSKRKSELVSGTGNTREVLQKYTPEFLNVLLTMSVVMMLVVYSIYTVLVLNSHTAVYSILFVLLGIFRYLYLSYSGKDTQQPERIIFSDLWIFTSAIGWIIFMYTSLY